MAYLLPGLFGALVIAALTVFAVRVWRAFHVPWAPLGVYGAEWHSVGGKRTREEVAFALSKAVDMLNGAFAVDVLSAIQGLRIYVASEPTWIDEWGRSVAGLQRGATLQVGSDLAALAHELCHLLGADVDHNWSEKQYTAAEAYAAWATQLFKH